ncbi:MAG: hypothetical protein ETSY1_24905 [Candidatus Entotheonella factor]|uniref:Cadmium carbonic anhydrase n=1 Tax=Entotheonella factor TaxID=1429438 RepID=W4LFV2_ENTF1|nr:MAG: hypothetical protein ETSY1_24905 [Candidatus Entotheonella factor]
MLKAIGFALVWFGGLMIIPFAAYTADAGCAHSGPQTPRDIANKAGSNAAYFSPAPSADKLNLCNIHFHKNAEHKGPQFGLSGGQGKYGGWKCNAEIQSQQKADALAPITVPEHGCTNVQPGDTVEVHWVFSSCNVKPGAGLKSCVSNECANPQVRVEAAVFLLVNDDQAIDFSPFDYHANDAQSYQQPMQLPDATGAVEFLGSTTGPNYTEQSCSPYQVTWNVRPQCRALNINTLHKWCQQNVFEEHDAHGVRQLVTDVKLLAPIR